MKIYVYIKTDIIFRDNKYFVKHDVRTAKSIKAMMNKVINPAITYDKVYNAIKRFPDKSKGVYKLGNVEIHESII